MYYTADINECELQTHNCSLSKERCINLHGSFLCICKQGLTGENCEDGKYDYNYP